MFCVWLMEEYSLRRWGFPRYLVISPGFLLAVLVGGLDNELKPVWSIYFWGRSIG